MKFHFGTANPHKARELAGILRPLGIGLALADPIEPEESGASFEENARIKAVAYGLHVGERVVKEMVRKRGCRSEEARAWLKLEGVYILSEDSGVVVPALGGLPGPWSARFSDCAVEAGRVIRIEPSGRDRDAMDAANNRRLIELMRGIDQPFRAAAFKIALIVTDPEGGVVFGTVRESAGWIAEEPRGVQGFGYDSVFCSGESFGKTWAEIDPMRKNLISHRRLALQDLSLWLAARLKEAER